MGLMRFLVPGRRPLTEAMLQRICITGLEEIPWYSRVYWDDDDLLVIERSVNDSGNVHVPWPVGRRERTLTTASLMERERPYQLDVELARGTISMIRNQLDAWRMAGMVVPDSVCTQLSDASGEFAKAATAQHQPAEASRHAQQAIEIAARAAFELGIGYTEQALGVRRRQTPRLTTLFGINLGRLLPSEKAAPQVCETFNTGVVPLHWRRIEEAEGARNWTGVDKQLQWCQKHGLKVCSGPLLQFDAAGVPDWSYLWEDDFDSLLAFMLEHVAAVVERYRGKVQLWQVAGRVNSGDVLSLTEEQQLRIVAHAVEKVRQRDTRAPVVVSFDQPWAQYLAHQRLDLPPLHFADTLVRAELGLAGLGLEINAGYDPGGTMFYSLIDYSRQLDRWSQLGLPLLVALTTPSASTPAGKGKMQPIASAEVEPCTPASQGDWVKQCVPLLLAKYCVQAVIWNQLCDTEPYEYPHGGLFDEAGEPKPALESLHGLRQRYLN